MTDSPNRAYRLAIADSPHSDILKAIWSWFCDWFEFEAPRPGYRMWFGPYKDCLTREPVNSAIGIGKIPIIEIYFGSYQGLLGVGVWLPMGRRKQKYGDDSNVLTHSYELNLSFDDPGSMQQLKDTLSRLILEEAAVFDAFPSSGG